jgi:hypothetical protein
MKSRPLFTPSGKPKIPSVNPPAEILKADWRNKYAKIEPFKSYQLENSTDDSELNRMVQLKNLDNTNIVNGKPGKLYYDKTNKKVKIFISETDGWKDLSYT